MWPTELGAAQIQKRKLPANEALWHILRWKVDVFRLEITMGYACASVTPIEA